MSLAKVGIFRSKLQTSRMDALGPLIVIFAKPVRVRIAGAHLACYILESTQSIGVRRASVALALSGDAFINVA